MLEEEDIIKDTKKTNIKLIALSILTTEIIIITGIILAFIIIGG
jgi:hypothetical protein